MLLSCLRVRLRAPALIALVVGLLLLVWAPAGAQEQGAVVDVLQISGPVDSRVEGHIERALERAADQGVEAVVLELQSDGGLRTDGAALADVIADSTVPLVLWVGPPGARLTGAGALLAQSAHVLAMAPATVLGAASPLDLASPDDAVDTAALLARHAERNGRSAEAAAAMADGAAVVATGPATGAIQAELDVDALPWAVDRDQVQIRDDAALIEEGLADVVALELPDVLRAADGREVSVSDGSGGFEDRVIDLDPVTANVRFDNLGLVDRVLHTMADPSLAYLLVIGGALAMLFEVYQPGFGVAGGSGAVVLALGLYGFWVLPVNAWAVALIAVGLALLAVDLAIAGLGLVTISGTAALGAGSYWLYSGPPPLQAPVWLLALVVAFCVLYFVVIMTTVLRAQGAQAMAGAEHTFGQHGIVRSMLNPEGHVYVDGALWRARAPEGVGKVKTGTPVKVIGMSDDGLTLDVEIEPERASQST